MEITTKKDNTENKLPVPSDVEESKDVTILKI